MSVKLMGFRELSESLKRFGARGNAALDKACFEVADQLAEAIEAKAPIGRKVHPQTGNKRLGVSWLNKTRYPGLLKRSITVEKSKGDRDNLTGISYKVGPNKHAFYGLFLEYGTRKMGKHPFVRPALDESQSDLIKTAAKVAQEELK